MLNRYSILMLMGMMALTSMTSAIQVTDYVGPYKISFQMPVDEVDLRTSDPFTGRPYAVYDLIVTAKKWFVDIAITKFDDPQEINLSTDYRAVATIANVDESKVLNRTIDDRSTVYALGTNENGCTLGAIYWLDSSGGYGSEKVKIRLINNDETQGDFSKILDTLKIERIS